MDTTPRNIPMVVCAINASGQPDIYQCSVSVTPEQYNNGDHYDMAKDKAAEEKYEGPMVAYDPMDAQAFFGLFDDSAGAILAAQDWCGRASRA